jgi:hypothetical protein
MKSKVCIILILLLSLLITQSFSQEKPAEKPKYGWQKEMVGGINLTQTSFDNWAQGGENSFAWQLNLNFKFINDQEKSNWANSGKFTYGSTKSGEQGIRKSVDEIKLESVLTYKLGICVNPYVGVTGETQFAPGYDYRTTPKTKISDFMDPAYFRESVGVGYQPNKIVKTRLGAALKQTVTRSTNYPINYADNPKTAEIEKFKNEIGVESVTDVAWKISENTLFTSQLELFSALKAFNATDVNWDNVLTTKISKYFNVNFNFKLFYDRDISKRRQLKQAIAFGFAYSFI